MTADTPKRWGEYLEHIKKYNQSCRDMYKFNLDRDVQRYESLPWYKRMFAQDPRRDMWRDYHWDKSPSLLDYYDWDVRTRNKATELKRKGE